MVQTKIFKKNFASQNKEKYNFFFEKIVIFQKKKIIIITQILLPLHDIDRQLREALEQNLGHPRMRLCVAGDQHMQQRLAHAASVKIYIIIEYIIKYINLIK